MSHKAILVITYLLLCLSCVRNNRAALNRSEIDTPALIALAEDVIEDSLASFSNQGSGSAKVLFLLKRDSLKLTPNDYNFLNYKLSFDLKKSILINSFPSIAGIDSLQKKVSLKWLDKNSEIAPYKDTYILTLGQIVYDENSNLAILKYELECSDGNCCRGGLILLRHENHEWNFKEIYVLKMC